MKFCCHCSASAGQLDMSAGVIVRDYVPSDDAAIDALQHHSSMEHSAFRWLRMLGLNLHAYIRVTAQDIGGYNSRALDFDDHIILVAEDTARLVGVINVGIKSVRCQGVEGVRVGFLYGLRVHEDLQGVGLGRRMLETAEEQARRQGCQRMLLTVNDDNTAARRFFDRAGYSIASQRVLRFSPLWTLGLRPALADFVRVELRPDSLGWKQRTARKHGAALLPLDVTVPDHDYALLETISDGHNGRDMAPDVALLARCRPFVGAVHAELEDGSRAGGMLWDASQHKTFVASGYLVDLARRGLAPWVRAAIVSSAGVVCVYNMWQLRELVLAERFGFAAMVLSLQVVCVWGARQAASFMAFVHARNMKMVRFFGYYAEGARGSELLHAVYWKARETARNACSISGAAVLINADQHDPLLPCLKAADKPPSKATKEKLVPRTRFLHKALLGSVHPQPMSPDMFFDPRDI